jgi:mannose-6-phosphate isomerase-like protein (cupin superfamily)
MDKASLEILRKFVMPDPIILAVNFGNLTIGDAPAAKFAINGSSFVIHEWSGSGPESLHVHHSDDEGWLVLEGTLTFKFEDREVEVPAGSFVFVPAGVAHSYYEAHGPTRYLIFMTPRIKDLVSTLHTVPFDQHPAVLKQYQSEIVVD